MVEAQAGEIVGLKAQLHMVLDREADTHCRHDAKVEAQAAEIDRLREIVAIMHTAFAAYADSPAKQEAITLAGKVEQ
jgi:anti-sigma factor RsiW